MYQIENFELPTSRVVAFHSQAGCVIRVTAGRLWLTVQGRPDDVWLHAGQSWTAPQGHATVWLSAEPAASLQMAYPVAAPRRAHLRQPLPLGGLARWWRSPAHESLGMG